VVLSHYHAVRVLGASAFDAEIIVAHENTRALVAERIPGAELRVFADASHLSVVEAGDEFLAAVSSFLASLPSR